MQMGNLTQNTTQNTSQNMIEDTELIEQSEMTSEKTPNKTIY